MNWKIPLFKCYWEDDDIESVNNVIKRGTYWATGPEIKNFETNIAKYVGAKYALVFNSGTSALHADISAHEIGKDDEVILPSFTFVSTSNSVALTGAKPVFAEIEDQSYGLDPADVERKITDKTKAIIPVHYAGAPCKEIKTLKKIADKNGLILIEDAAESLGSKIGTRFVGTFGNSAMFSFCQNKIITTGEGGAIVTNSEKIYEKLKLIRSHGRLERTDDYFSTTKEMDYIQLGYNYRISTISAALGISQLKKIDKIISMRRKIAEYFNRIFSEINGIKIPETPEDHFHIYQIYTIRLRDKKIMDMMQKFLIKRGIMNKVYFDSVHLKTFYRKLGYKEGNLPKTENISERVLSLPIYPSMNPEEMIYITNSIKEFFKLYIKI